MIKTITASSADTDDIDLCVADFQNQLDVKGALKRRSIGLMFGPPETMEAAKVVCRAMPFDVIGCLTPLTTVNGVRRDSLCDAASLTMTVLTSDEAVFAAGLSDELGDDGREAVTTLYEKLAAKLPRPPKLVLIFCSRDRPQGDHLVQWLDEASSGCPLTGCFSANYSFLLHEPDLLFNGQLLERRVGLALIDTDAEPAFLFISTPEAKRMRHRAVITASEGNLIKEINGRPVLDFLRSLNLIDHEGRLRGAMAVPIIVESPDCWRALPMVINALTEEGHVRCSLDLPSNATLTLSSLERMDVIESMRRATAIIKTKSFNLCLLFSCMGRNLALGFDYLQEIKELEAALGPRLPYCFAYSGGEICPIPDAEGRMRNAYHNLALVVCLL
ncbi:MAG: FIST C-terminal domain-containing protein [Deltaproteobacteria bacterium]|jgi:hypothetical protein|nr:FIST C-terminal domain-containing protein [Deltaproteobacteria bacterium]